MCQLMENRTAAEMVAVEALLKLAGMRYDPNARSDTAISSPKPIKYDEEQQQVKTATIVTSTPHPKPLKKRPYIAPPEDQSSTSDDFNASHIGKCEVFSPVLNETIVPKPMFKLTPKVPAKSNSGRLIKRTRRFISESDDSDELDAQKSTKPGKVVKFTVDKSATKISQDDKDIVHPAKKIKIEPDSKNEEPKVTDKTSITKRSGGGSSGNKQNQGSRLKRGILNTNFQESIQSDKIRHSRLFETAYELQNCSSSDANVEFQYRAVENLMAQKTEIDSKRQQFTMNRSSRAMELMQKLRNIKNRQQVCDEFSLKFCPTTSAKWKPFTEDEKRSTDISNYKSLAMVKKVSIKYWIDQFLTQKLGKEKSRSTLIEIIKMMPDRPEIRHAFINGHLPKLVTAHKQAVKKSKGLAIKAEIIDIDAALPYHI